MARGGREHGPDEATDEEVVARGDEDGREDDEGEGRCEGALWGSAVGLGEGGGGRGVVVTTSVGALIE